eukprot:762773-Hanusia_phi.AAC.1
MQISAAAPVKVWTEGSRARPLRQVAEPEVLDDETLALRSQTDQVDRLLLTRLVEVPLELVHGLHQDLLRPRNDRASNLLVLSSVLENIHTPPAVDKDGASPSDLRLLRVRYSCQAATGELPILEVALQRLAAAPVNCDLHSRAMCAVPQEARDDRPPVLAPLHPLLAHQHKPAPPPALTCSAHLVVGPLAHSLAISLRAQPCPASPAMRELTRVHHSSRRAWRRAPAFGRKPADDAGTGPEALDEPSQLRIVVGDGKLGEGRRVVCGLVRGDSYLPPHPRLSACSQEPPAGRHGR